MPSGSFLEFYASPSLTFSTDITRFRNRITKSDFICGREIHLTESKSLGIVKKTKLDIATNGTWLTYGDCLKRGSYTNEVVNVLPRSTYFGLMIHEDFCSCIVKNIFALYAFASSQWPDINIHNEPYVVYHGTSQDSVKSILDTGLKTTEGMLGNAIYFGTFWKAYRFSCMKQDYSARPGAVLRCYAFWKNPVIKNAQSDRCKCSVCKGLQAPPVDHNAEWSKLGDFVIAPANSILKNEEYACLSDTNIVIDCVGHTTKKSLHHEPLDRTFEID